MRPMKDNPYQMMCKRTVGGCDRWSDAYQVTYETAVDGWDQWTTTHTRWCTKQLLMDETDEGIHNKIMLEYLYCAAYTRMTMNESSSSCEQRRITFNDDGQRVQFARHELPAPHYICMYRLLPTTPPSPSTHYYPRFIAGTNLPTPDDGYLG